MNGCCLEDPEFGIVTCANPDHCEHPTATGDGAGRFVCDVCGHPGCPSCGRFGAHTCRRQETA